MDKFSSVSETALITLRSRVIESQKNNPVIRDVVGGEVLECLEKHIEEDTKRRILKKKLPRTLTCHIALRGRKYDEYAKAFVEANPDGLIVNLGAGFDTRYFRSGLKPEQYIEVDLEPITVTKKMILKDKIDYQMIAGSVLAEEWISQVRKLKRSNILFLAEGLFMYLPQNDVENLLRKLSYEFTESQMVFETVNKRYTTGFMKKMVEMKMKRLLESNAGSSYDFGVYKGEDVENFSKKMRFLEEWSYLQEEDVKPAILKIFRNIKYFTRTQWTIRVAFG